MKSKKNPVAKALRKPKFRQRVVRDKTKYDRKKEKEHVRSRSYGTQITDD